MTEMSPAEAVFFAAAALPTSERASYLAQVCAGRADLRQRVEQMLAVQPLVGSFLEPAAEAGAATSAHAPGRLPPTEAHGDPTARVGSILAGRYKLIEEVGEGGMGTVFMAQQTEPVRRAVAVKVIKAGMDSKAVLVRFEAERQALAMMDHPNIAKVLDAGSTDGGRPFFVMELVKGQPITRFCDERKLTPRQRLELFVPVCQAIQHAHQKGVIHRDIKPSNVLVAMYDDRAVPKVIDFGVAKAAGQTLTDKTLMTGFGAVVGTPEYMSPEQANLNNLDIDTRSDVYSLGVLLYELLTGSTPVDRKSLGKAALLEILRVVREVEAPRPSAKLSTIDTLPSVAANRGTEPAKLSKLMKGELDWVVLKALEKDRTRRYETANGLARDIQRYLADEVVEARPPSVGYRLKKFVRRQMGQVIAASLILFALLAGMVGTTWGLIEAKKQEQIARDEAAEKEKALVAEAERAEGERPARLDAQSAKDKADQSAAAEKAANARAQKRLAQMLKANSLLISIFKNLDPNELAKGKRPLQAILVEKLDDAVAQLEGDGIGEPILVATMQMNFAIPLLNLGAPDKAVVLLEKALVTCQAEYGPDHRRTITGMIALARAYEMAKNLDRSQPLLEKAFGLAKANLGPDDHTTLVCMNNLAMGYRVAGKTALAVPILKESLGLHRVKLGPEHPQTLMTMNNLALGYQDTGRMDLAVPLFEETLRLKKARPGPDDLNTAFSMNNLAWAYHATGKRDLALPLYEKSLALRRALLGLDHPDTLNTLSNLGRAYCESRQGEKAAAIFKDLNAGWRKQFPPNSPEFLGHLTGVARELLNCGQYIAAEEMLRECLAIREKAQPDLWSTFNAKSILGGALLGQKKYADAEPLLLAGYEGMKQREKTIPPQATTRIPEALDRLIDLYAATNKPDEVKKWQAERARYPTIVAKTPEKK